MKDVNQVNHWIKLHGDLALDLVRIYLGVGLFVKSVYFMSHSDYLPQLMSQASNFRFAPAVVAHSVIFAHLVGGAFLAAGLMTRVAALVQLPILFAAVFFVHLPNVMTSITERQNLEFSGLVLFLLILISIYGAGRWSLDYVIGRKMNAGLFRAEHEPQKAS